MNLLIRSATVIDKKSEFHNQTLDILIRGGIISDIDKNIKNSKNYKELKLNNLSISNGWFDYSVCTGEPGYEERDNLLNTLNVAAKSGFTSLGIQPDTNPIIDKCTEVEYLKSLASKSNIDIHPIGALTKQSTGNELAEILEMGDSGAIAFGDFKKPIENPNLLKLALLYCKNQNYPIFSFPFEKKLNIDGVINEGITSTLLGLKGIPAISEEINIKRDLTILEYTGGRLHIPTISTAKSVDIIRKAKSKKLNVTCSTSINNLFFSDLNVLNFNTNFKVLPPLRSENDIDALIIGVKDGTIDLVTSDHNPLNIELKNLEFDNANFGSIGLESFFGALNKLFSTKMSIDILTRGKKIFNIHNSIIKIGELANFTLFNPLKDYIFKKEHIHSISKNSIFIDIKLKGFVYGTISNGKLTINE
ncbi:MAG: dihydroorotase [Flavobacteriaceae bacterium]|nr:dihydroorotase [Flavobacteriaceae bacterium]